MSVLHPADSKAAGDGQPPSQYLFQFESSDISRLRADVQSLGFVSLVRCVIGMDVWFAGGRCCVSALPASVAHWQLLSQVACMCSVACSPGGMVRLAHAVIKHFLLAFKVRGSFGIRVCTVSML